MKDLYYIMDEILHNWNTKPIAYLEQVHAFPTDGRSSAFKFGSNYGLWQGLLLGFEIECKFVAPQVWMKPLGLPKDKKERKNKIKALAQNIIDKQKVPTKVDGRKVTLNTSDAIMIAMYGYLKEKEEDNAS